MTEQTPTPDLQELLERILRGFTPEPFASIAPELPGFGAVLPAPVHHDHGPVESVRAPAVSIRDETDSSASDVLTDGLFRSGVPFSIDGDGYPIDLRIDPSGRDEEGYAVEADADGMVVVADTPVGLVRGAATARQLVRKTSDRVEVATGRIDDHPVVPVRMLAGWGLYRAENLDEAIDLAIEGKFNRVLYNWWTGTLDERMGRREEQLVERARQHGVELVCELRRQQLGSGASLRDRDVVERLLSLYDQAADRGFRCFGLLFDDAELDPIDDELTLIAEFTRRVTDRVGEGAELWICPRYYWFPGELDYSWLATLMSLMGGDPDDPMLQVLGDSTPRPVQEATRRQAEYHEALAEAVPDGAHLYLANWFSATPADWRERLEEGWLQRIGRPPAFWDNQLVNDIRGGILYPYPLAQRPPEFAQALSAYSVNSCPPLAGHAAGLLTSGAWAWNPHGYDPAESFGAAIGRLFGDAAETCARAYTSYGAFLAEVLGDRMGFEDVEGGIRSAVARGTEDLDGRLDEVLEAVAGGHQGLSPSAHPLARRALHDLAREADRMRLEVEFLLSALDPSASSGSAAERGERLVAAIRDVLTERLPQVPELRALAADPDFARQGARTGGVPGTGYAMHFVLGPLRGLRAVLRELPGPEP